MPPVRRASPAVRRRLPPFVIAIIAGFLIYWFFL
jgi:hypothetical protein